MSVHDIVWLLQAGVAALTTLLLLCVAFKAHRTRVDIQWPHVVLLAVMVAGVSFGNIITSLATALDADETRNLAGLYIRITLLAIAAYGATLVPWKRK